MEYTYRNGIDTKACFIVNTTVFPHRPTEEEIFGVFQNKFACFGKLPNTILGELTVLTRPHVIVNADGEKDSTIEYIYGYHIEKRKSKWKRDVSEQETDFFGNPIRPYVMVSPAHWVATVYRIPLKNIKSFIQHPSYFDLRFINDEQLEFRAAIKRGFPVRNLDKSFNKEYFSKISERLVYAWAYRKSRNIKCEVGNEGINIFFDMETGNFRLQDHRHIDFTDEQLKELLNSNLKTS